MPAAADSQRHGPKPKTVSFENDVRPVIQKYCLKCHAGAPPAAGLSFESFKTEASVRANRDVWDKIALNLGSGHMPPAGMPHPA